MTFLVGLKCLIIVFFKSQRALFAERFYTEFMKVIEASDVIIQVLDARDPLGSRCVELERMVHKAGPLKRVILLLNKIGTCL